MSIGTCYGFGIDSDLQFQFLRGGEGQRLEVIVSDVQPDATGAALVQEWSSADGTSPLARLYARDGVYLLWSFAVGWLTIDPHAPSISVPHTPYLISREQITLVTATLLCFHARGDVGLHACSVDIGGEAIVFAAPGKFGKTTLGAGFWRAGHRLLSEDLMCLRRSPVSSAVPGPAMIRLRPDVAEHVELPHAERLAATATGVYYALEESRRGDCEPVPIRAVLVPQPSEDGDRRLERVEPEEAVRDLWSLCGLLPTEADFAVRFEAVADLVASTPVYSLFHPMRYDALDGTVEWITASV